MITICDGTGSRVAIPTLGLIPVEDRPRLHPYLALGWDLLLLLVAPPLRRNMGFVVCLCDFDAPVGNALDYELLSLLCCLGTVRSTKYTTTTK